VAINELKRFVIDWAQREGRSATPSPEPDNGMRVAVVGAGPSGLAAAHELRLRGYRVTLLDANAEPGGLLLTGIPPFRLPREALRRDVERILAMGVEFSGDTLLGRDLQLQDLLDRGFDAIYLAVGAHRGLVLGLDGEHGPGAPRVVDALAYLKSSFSDGVNDGAWTGRRVVVVGGGNAAIDAARTARRQGAERVMIAYRRRREEMPAIAEEIDAAEAEGIELLTQLQPLSIFRGARPGLECVRTEPGEPDASGRRRPVPVGGSETLLEADQIIVAIGQTPDLPTSLGEGELELRRHKNGTLEVDPQTGQTSHPRIFAGGDAAPGERTVTWAMACGQRAAWAIDRALRGAARADERPPPPLPQEPTRPATTGFSRLSHRPAGRPRPAELPAAERTSSFSEVVAPLTEEQARAEAARCLACGVCGNCRACIDLFGCPAFFIDKRDGRPQIDPKICTGCGVCAAFCPNGAIMARQEGQA
jgi:NADPH-dependent glutamate synthase beta subunit-like oxidoreductase